MSRRALLLLGLLAGAALLQVAVAEDAEAAVEEAAGGAEDAEDDYAEIDRAFLVVRKYFKDEYAVQGRNLTVHLELFNAGTATANDVNIVDAAAPEGFTLLEGSLEVAIGKVDVGGTASASYVLVPTKGAFGAEFAPATVTYRAEFDGTDKQTAKSTAAGIYVLTPAQQLQRYALIAGSYATLGIVHSTTQWRNLLIVGVLLAAVFGGSSFHKGLTAKKAERSRKAALAELEKEQ